MAQHRLAEGAVVAVLMALEADLDEGLDAEAQALAVEQRERPTRSARSTLAMRPSL